MSIEYVDVVKRYPLWASIPPQDRITEQDLRRRHPIPGEYMEQKIAERLEILSNPSCELATHWLEYDNHKWGPCVNPVAEGQSRCRRHGGESVTKPKPPRPRIAELEAEVASLRAQLAAQSSSDQKDS